MLLLLNFKGFLFFFKKGKFVIYFLDDNLGNMHPKS